MKDPACILVVDDTPSNVKLLFDVLTARGYAVRTATTGTEALEAIERECPDLVLLDVMMPGMSGYDVCRKIRSNPATVMLPVVMVTALDPGQERVKGIEAGADDFLSKPINQPEILARVRSLLRIKSLHDELSDLNRNLEARVTEQVSQLERLSRLKRFFSPALAELIVTGGVDDPLRTHRREVAIVILDLVGFGAFAETAEPEEVMSVLRQYHAEMGRLVLAHDGTLERFAGDAIIVVFNDPVEIPDAPARALSMAWAMRQRARELAHEWDKRGWRLPLRIGVAMGHATIGAFGFEERLDYGVVGRVNGLAAVLCNAADGGHVLISQKVAAAVEALADVQEIEVSAPRGTTRPIRAFRVLGLKS